MTTQMPPASHDDYPRPRCGNMVSGGGMMSSYPCWIEVGESGGAHDGPCAAVEVPSTVRSRQAWENEQKGLPSGARLVEDVPSPSTEPSRSVPRDGHDQPLPTTSDAMPNVQALLRAEVDAREAVGIERYGSPLQPFNGRDTLRDAFEEALDLATYLRGLLAARDLSSEAAVPMLAEVLVEASRKGGNAMDLARAALTWVQGATGEALAIPEEDRPADPAVDGLVDAAQKLLDGASRNDRYASVSVDDMSRLAAALTRVHVAPSG